MIYDPAWDMPRINWRPQGSFEIPEIPPVYEPDAEPLVCLPAINQYWLPFVMGALDQLRNPSSWLVADDDAMYNTLARVSKLREMLGVRVPCMSLMIRFDGPSCELQQSTDGGTTWSEVDGWADFNACLPPQTLIDFDSGCTLNQSLDGGMTYEAVPGWIDNFSGCVQEYTPIIDLPPNPNDQLPNELACSIATFLANEVILNAMSAAVTNIQDDLTLLAFGASVLSIIPEFVLVRLGYDAISIIYTAVAEGTLSDFEDAIADGDLWLAVSCAIYDAIVGQGFVTPGNFAAIIANVEAVSYPHSDVIDAIVAYLNSLGATGLAQLSQRAGLEVGADCSSCAGATWCYTFTDGNGHLEGQWSTLSGAYVVARFGYSPTAGSYDPGQGWISDLFPGGGTRQALGIGTAFDRTWITNVNVAFRGGDSGNGGTRIVGINQYSLEATLSQSSGEIDQDVPIGNYCTSIEIEVDTNIQPANSNFIHSVTITGLGVCPFGTPNC